MTPQEMVTEFHQIYGHPIAEKPVADIPAGRKQLRHDLIKEEFKEYDDAVEANDIVEIADALGDLIYVIYGAALEHGIQDLDRVVTEIHRSNLSKLGRDGKPIYREDGKVMKGPGYFPPEIETVLNR